MFLFGQHFETAVVVVWAIVAGAVLLNVLACWMCCCCRTFDRPRRVLLLATALVIIFALATTFYYAADLEQLWPAINGTPRALFSARHGTVALKRLKWPPGGGTKS